MGSEGPFGARATRTVTPRTSATRRNMLMHRVDEPPFHKDPPVGGVLPAKMPQLKQAVVERLGQRLAVILTVPQLRQTSHHGRVVAGVALLEFIEKIQHGRTSGGTFMKPYGALHKR